MGLKITIAVITFFLGLGNGFKTIKKWKEFTRSEKILAVSSIALLLLVFIDAVDEIVNKNRRDKIEAISGEFQGITTDKVVIGFIDGAAMESINGKDTMTLWATDLGPLISGRIINGQLFINFLIRNEYGELVASVEDNNWAIYRKEYEYNYDKTSFEIVTPVDKRVLFQVKIDEGIVRIAGLMIDQHGLGFYFYKDPKTGNTAIQEVFPNKIFELPNYLHRMFKYPRKSYLGVKEPNPLVFY